ncbi:hypothetical protein [Streptomyces sp. B1I3]|uniref:hypothetical protein n=1 Tax=Streptomyces sp. B1I3 TaxID=3042264 RepID=UPI002780EBFF|nr:hypothetical protein [Streptomyces sp. B1I3]MDQ0791982.1 hypothetical protein [Streptomyces sp. B1I3]
MARTEEDPSIQQRVEDVIRDFPFDNYGLNDIDIALNDHPDDQEWVPDLARKVLATLDEAVSG